MVAAFVWLSLSLYFCIVIPREFAQSDIPVLDLPLLSRLALSVFDWYGTSICALVGLLGCVYAYARRNVRLANGLIVAGTLCILLLVAELVLHATAKPVVRPFKMAPPLGMILSPKSHIFLKEFLQ